VPQLSRCRPAWVCSANLAIADSTELCAFFSSFAYSARKSFAIARRATRHFLSSPTVPEYWLLKQHGRPPEGSGDTPWKTVLAKSAHLAHRKGHLRVKVDDGFRVPTTVGSPPRYSGPE
jgi:hypothetical protein